MLLDNNFLQKHQIEEYQVIKQFNSKKNKVYLIKALVAPNLIKEYVFKEQPSKLKKETEILLRLRTKGVNVPEIIYIGQKHILMEYIPGQTLLEYICQLERENIGLIKIKIVFENLARWLNDFYLSASYSHNILGDLNFRNFILFGGKTVYGIDFEDCRQGYREEDIGRLCAFGLTYRPEFTGWKLKTYKFLFHFMVKELKLNPELTKEYFIKELNSIKERRGLEFPIKLNIFKI